MEDGQPKLTVVALNIQNKTFRCISGNVAVSLHNFTNNMYNFIMNNATNVVRNKKFRMLSNVQTIH